MNQSLKLRGQGITDQAELDKGMKLMDKGLDERQAGAIVNFASGLTKGDVMNNPDKIKNRLQNAGLNNAQDGFDTITFEAGKEMVQKALLMPVTRGQGRDRRNTR